MPEDSSKADTPKQSGAAPDSNDCAAYLKALADPTRLRVVQALRCGAKSVSSLAEALGADMAIVSHHLRTLFHAGIVVTKREGRFVYYSLNAELTDKLPESGKLDFGCCKLELGDE